MGGRYHIDLRVRGVYVLKLGVGGGGGGGGGTGDE